MSLPTMIHTSPIEPLTVSRIGSVASRVLNEARSGRVAAVFERSVYVDFDGRFVCFGSEEIGNGPLNALVPPASVNWCACAVTRGDRVCVDASGVSLGRRCTLDASNARVWMPPAPGLVRDVAALSSNLENLHTALRLSAPASGLAGLVCGVSASATPNPLHVYASKPFAELRRWLAASLEDGWRGVSACPRDVCGLLGAGPGLTPSGDDLLAGAMVTLHRLGESRVLAELAERVGAELANRTNAISAAHLIAAMEGLAAEPIISTIDNLIHRPCVAPEAIMRRLCSIGATSGSDGLAGIVAVLDCWLAGQVQALPKLNRCA